MDRYVEERSPKCVYLPSEKVLFKLMKACILVENTHELWFYTKNNKK